MSRAHDVRNRPERPHPDATLAIARRSPQVGALGTMGVVGVAVAAAVSVVLGVIRPGYSFVALPIVALLSGPNALVQSANFVVLGVSVILAAAGLHLGIRPGRFGASGPALLALSGVGPVLAGLTGPVPVHFVVTFVGAGIGLILVSRRMAHDPAWQRPARYALVTGVMILVLIPIHSALALPDGAPLHPWWGLLNWTVVALWLTCTAVLAGRLVRLARTT